MDLNSCEWSEKIVNCKPCEKKGEKCDLGMKAGRLTFHATCFVNTNKFAHVWWSHIEEWPIPILASCKTKLTTPCLSLGQMRFPRAFLDFVCAKCPFHCHELNVKITNSKGSLMRKWQVLKVRGCGLHF